MSEGAFPVGFVLGGLCGMGIAILFGLGGPNKNDLTAVARVAEEDRVWYVHSTEKAIGWNNVFVVRSQTNAEGELIVQQCIFSAVDLKPQKACTQLIPKPTS